MRRSGEHEAAASGREKAHRILDGLLDLLAGHAPAAGALRLRVDPKGHVHVGVSDVSFDAQVLVAERADGPRQPASGSA
jgi:hypothetical protein